MNKNGACTVLIDTAHAADAESLVLALEEAGFRALLYEHDEDEGLVAADASLNSEGGGADEELRRVNADFFLVDAERWSVIYEALPLPPRPYIVVLLITPERESSVSVLLDTGAFDYVLRGGEHWQARVASYFRALAALRRRFAGGFSALDRRYEELVHSLPDIVYELDSEGRFTFINNSVRLLGYDPEELIGRHFSTLLSEEDAPAVDRETVLETLRGVTTGSALSPKLFNERRGIERRTENLEVKLKRKPGRDGNEDMIVTVVSYGEVSAAGEYARRGDAQDFIGSVGIIRDITLRRKSEEMLKKLYHAVDQLSAGVLIADRSFKVEYVNPGFFRMAGATPQDVIGSELLSHFDITPEKAEEMRALVREGFDANIEARLLGRPGLQPSAAPSIEGRWTALHVSPVRSPAGLVTHAILICEDISQRKAMEELVRLAKEEAERADKAKSHFLASMSHDLRSPVAGILAAARLIEMGGGEPERRAASIIAGAQGLLDMLGDILDFVRFESGTGTVRTVPFGLAAFIARVCDPYRKKAEEKGLGFDIGPVPDETLRSDPDKLGRAFAALLANAVTFTDRGRITVTASIERRSGNVPHLSLSVSDTGAGIAPEDQSRVFTPFVQLTSPYSKPGGAGIGLSLARNIVRALGGEIRLQSEGGRGSLFTILIPTGEPSEAGIEGHAPSKCAYRLLIVDDNEVNLDYMAAILENAGHYTTTASSGAEALRRLEERTYDAAILDVQMPGMNGIELGRRIRAYTGTHYDPDIPLAALTAFGPDEMAGVDSSFDGVFEKPVDVPKLLRFLNSAIDRREAPPLDIVRGRWTGKGSDARPVLEELKKDGARAIAVLRESTVSQNIAMLKPAARTLGALFSRLGCEKCASAVRRLSLALPDEEPPVLMGRIERLARAWESAADAAFQAVCGDAPDRTKA
jgi:PAS domain S-box-containing protein